MRWEFFFLFETDFLFKSASTPCEENSHSYQNEARHNYPGKPILKWAYHPGNLFSNGPTIQANLFSNGPSIQKCYSHMGMHKGIWAYRTKIRIYEF